MDGGVKYESQGTEQNGILISVLRDAISLSFETVKKGKWKEWQFGIHINLKYLSSGKNKNHRVKVKWKAAFWNPFAWNMTSKWLIPVLPENSFILKRETIFSRVV